MLGFKKLMKGTFLIRSTFLKHKRHLDLRFYFLGVQDH